MHKPFKELLIEQAGLLSLSQSDCDLLLIAQANSITNIQLSLTGLHGTTKDSGRISLKHLESAGYLLPHHLLGPEKEKYYTLSAKAKKWLENLFGSKFLSELSIDLERQMPSGALQVPHRIHSDDLYPIGSYPTFPYGRSRWCIGKRTLPLPLRGVTPC